MLYDVYFICTAFEKGSHIDTSPINCRTEQIINHELHVWRCCQLHLGRAKKKTDDNIMYFLHWRGECTFMSFSNGEFLTIIDLPEGTHQYRFYVDGNWAYEQSEVKFWSLHTSYYAINLRFSSLFRICYACCFTEWLNNVCIWKEKLICCVMCVKNNATSTLTCRKFSV